MKIILKYDINNIKYMIIEDKGKYKSCKMINEQLLFNLDGQEKRLMELILEKLTPTSNKIKIPSYILEENLYEVNYDYQKDLFSFKPLPNKEHLRKLNLLFNYRNEYLFSTKNDQAKFIKRVVFIGNKQIILYLDSDIDFNILKDIEKNLTFKNTSRKLLKISKNEESNEGIELKESIDPDIGIKYINIPDITLLSLDEQLNRNDKIIEKEDLSFVEYLNDEVSVDDLNSLNSILKDNKYNYDYLIEVLYSNNKLSEQEKEKIFRILRYIEKDNKKINIKKLIEIIQNLEIKYNIEPYNEDERVKGIIRDNVIEFFQVNNLDDVDRIVFVQQISYALQLFKNISNPFFQLTLNVIINNEYQNINIKDDYLTSMMKALIELVGAKVFCEYQFNSNIEIIEHGLEKIIDDKKLNYKLIALLNEYYYLVNNEGDKINIKKLVDEIYNLFSLYYEAKYEKNIDNDLIMQFYLNSNSFKSMISKKYNQPIELIDNCLEIVKMKKYFKNEDINNNSLIISYPLLLGDVSVIELEEAIQIGLIAEGSNEKLVSNVYFNDLGQLIYMPITKEKVEIEINNENRYLKK